MPTPSKRRIVITGMGAITGFGEGVETFWNSISQGKSAVGKFDLYPSELFTVRIAAQAPKKFPLLGDKVLLTRPATLALLAAREALQSSRLENGKGVALSSAIGWGAPTLDELNIIRKITSGKQDNALVDGLGEDYAKRVSTGYGQNVLNDEFKFSGPLLSSLSACAASTQAIGEAAALIQDGEVQVALAGGADSRLHPLGITGYHLLGALTKKGNDCPEQASRPFDKAHSGFVIGEGAGFLVLEELEHALARSADIHAEVVSWSAAADGYRVTDPDPEGEGASRCMRLSIDRAGIDPDQVGYVNAHGTSTPANDRAECHALRKTFGDHIWHLPVSSTKSMIGHLSMAAGAVETIATVLALEKGVLPPTLNFMEPEEGFNFDFIPNNSRVKSVEFALKNSFGFGGQNASLLLKGWSEAP